MPWPFFFLLQPHDGTSRHYIYDPLAEKRSYGETRVELRIADAYDLWAVPGSFTAAFAGFFWSYVPRRRLSAFLNGLHRRLGPGGLVVFLDNRFVAGSSTPISRVDSGGDSFQLRRLKDGSTREVLKNFPEESELERAVTGAAEDGAKMTLWKHYWCLEYRVTSADPSRE